MQSANWCNYTLNFITPGGTSRGILKQKETYFIKLEKEGKVAYGECALFKGLSADDLPNYELKLQEVVEQFSKGVPQKVIFDSLLNWPSIKFGFETAWRALQNSHPFEIYPTEFTSGKQKIPINGLIWMGSFDFMLRQIEEKLNQGFRCIKIKVGAIELKQELNLLAKIRQHYNSRELELRLDANGAFPAQLALEYLNRFSEFEIHSIEQPIQVNQWDELAEICLMSPIPVALDEELIGVFDFDKKKLLLNSINPQYIILKPALVGGFGSCDEWIQMAEQNETGWWITSALESNIGLNAIAQYCATKQNTLPQGLGTGKLFSNNFKSPLEVQGNYLCFTQKEWDIQNLPL